MPAGPAIIDREAFIRAETRLHRVPHVPEIELYVADEAMDIWERTEEQLEEIGLPPPFWAFAWAGGQALARYVLDHPETVTGKRILDFAAGSGLVAIAAKKAGADHVMASEIDEFALTAIDLNALHNDVEIIVDGTDLTQTDGSGYDVILAGDIFYEKSTADRVLAWLDKTLATGAAVLVGDPGRSYLPKSRLTELETYTIPVVRSLEDAEIKRTTVWRLNPAASTAR